MTARVFVVREAGEVDLRAASEAVRLIVAATANEAVIAKANAIMSSGHESGRENLVVAFSRSIGRLHMALTSVNGPRRPFGRGELVLLRGDPYGVTARVPDMLLDSVAAIESLAGEIDLSAGYVAAGVVPLPAMDVERRDDDLFAASLITRLGLDLSPRSFPTLDEGAEDERRLCLYGRRVAEELFSDGRIDDEDALLLASDAVRVLGDRAWPAQRGIERREWQETLSLMQSALGAGRLDDAWELVNDLTSAIARMRITRTVVS